MKFKALLTGASLATLAMAATSANALTFNLSAFYTGGNPNGTAPWVTITVLDVAANKVNVSVSHNASSAAGQFVSDVYFNLDPFVGGITISNEVNGSKRGGMSNALDGVNGGAGNAFDLGISFVTSNAGGGANRLKPGEVWSGDLTGSGLSEAKFMALSNNGLQVGAHLQGITGQTYPSAHITTPEPGSIAALGLGALVLLRRRKKA